VIDLFPAGQQNQIRNTLSEALKGRSRKPFLGAST
jgi:Tfp pilus assembly pilus retraction ATPase PilT